MNKTYKIMTFGCQMNENDSEKISGLLKNMGYTPEEDVNKAGVVILNTCSVRENADVRVFGNLGTFKSVKKVNPDLVLAVCGCMMQQPEIVKKIKEKYPQVDLVFGTHNIHQFPQMLGNYLQRGERIFEIWDDSHEIIEDLPVDRKYPFKSFVTIMNGCNNFCTYCIVPYTRGREVSRQPEKIIEEVTRLADEGCLEVTLLGQNVNSYGNDLKTGYHFADLLRDLNQIEKIKRIRFMTSHPKDLSDELIEVMAQSQKICKHLHLPVQSGSTRILEKMNRRYTKEHYLRLVEKIKAAVPDISLTTDIIVGFPGETEEDFQETLDVVRKVRYDSAFTFIYSKRTGTPAAVLEEQVPEEIVKDRFNRLLKEVQSISAEVCSVHTKTVQRVLVESVNDHDDSLVTGRMSNNLLVHFPGEKDLVGKLVDVRLDTCKGFYYLGEMVASIRV